MTIESEISRIQSDKASMAAAIEEKGVTVGDASLDEYASLISQIEGGGGGGIDLDALCDYVDDENVFLRLYYYTDTINSASIGTQANCTATIVDRDLAYAFGSAQASMMEGAATINWATTKGGWYYDDQSTFEEVIIGDDAALQKLTGCKASVTSGSTWAYFFLAPSQASVVGNIAYHDITEYTDLNIFEQWYNATPSQEFSFGTMNAGSIVEVKFGKAWGLKESHGGGDPLYGMSEWNLGTYATALRSIGSFPQTEDFLSMYAGNIPFSNAPILNCPLVVPQQNFAEGWDQLFCNLPEFNSNAYFPNWIGKGTRVFYNCPKMTSTVYWGENITNLHAYSFVNTTSDCDAYQQGVKFTGPGASKAKALLPDLNDATNKKYRKILVV